MKKTVIAIVSFIILTQATSTVSAKEYPQRFWDVPKTHWAFGYIAEFADMGIIKGYEDGSFKPENTVSRAEWAKMILEAAGIKTDDESVYFSDLKDHWAIKYVNAAKGYFGALSDGLYYPDQDATREDVAASMVKLKGYDVNNVDYSYLMKFKDLDSISGNAKKYISVAVQNGLISGYEDNTFRGQATLTRAEAATLLCRAFLTREEQQEITATKDYSVYDGNFSGGGVFATDGDIMEVWSVIISNTTADSLEFNFIMSDSMFGIEGTLYRQPDGSYYGYGLHWHDKYKVSTSIWLESPDCILVTYTEPNGFTASERLYRYR